MKAVRRPINEIACRGKAFRLLNDYGIDEPGELNLEALAFDNGVLVIDEGIKGAEARLVRNASRGIIRINSYTREVGRRRFSISHELGHWFLHPKVSQAFLCTSADLRDYKNSPEEIEANMFAAELLMPTFQVNKILEKQEPSFDLVKGMAEKFKTSLTATAIRIAELSRTTMVVVSSSGGVIKWWRLGRDKWGPWICVGQPVHPQSLAYHLSSADSHAGPEEVDPLAWLDDNEFSRKTSVLEESLHFSEYGTTLTLLTLTEAEWELRRFSEKVLDEDVEFQPTVMDNFNIIFWDGKFSEAKTTFEKLELTNIRVMSRTRWHRTQTWTT